MVVFVDEDRVYFEDGRNWAMLVFVATTVFVLFFAAVPLTASSTRDTGQI